MIRSNLKLTHGTFEYFILQIAANTKIEEIKHKFVNFTALCVENKNIILEFANEFTFNDLTNLLMDINDIAKNFELNIHSILQNESIAVDSIFGIPVIDLPKTYKNKHIYNHTLVIDEPIRSGIKIENDGDIIVTTFVSDNAEVIATGNVHVYGEARGRIIAGASGNLKARIFIQNFNPELISIGGVYKTLENELPAVIMHNPVMVTLDQMGRLSIARLTK